jgi:predicted permease
VDALRQDLRFALRFLAKDRVLALTTIVTLALCLGANTAIFTVVRSILFRPLPYAESDRLVFLFESFPGARVERVGVSVPNYFDRLTLTDAFESHALYQFGGLRVGEGINAEGVASMNVTPSFFRVLRTRAARGRLFTEAEGQPGHNRVAVVSYMFARRHPGGVDGIIGRDLRLNDERYTVVGVLPDGFHFLNPDIRVWVPLAFTDAERAEDRRYGQNHEQIGRLAAGATLEQAQQRIDAQDAAVIERAGSLKSALVNAGFHTRVVSLEADLVRNVRAALHVLWGGVVFVLLIGAVNITNLSLSRASGRLKELATRYALGAARARVTRQLITEAMVLTIIGGLLGLMAGFWSLDALRWLGLADLPRSHEIRMDATVVAMTMGVALVLGVIIGALPAVHVARLSASVVLRDDSRTGTSGRGARYIRGTLVVAQVALAFVLLIGAGLLLASFRQLLAVDPGFTAEHVITGRVSPLRSRYPNDDALRAYATRALERIRALPGVHAAGVTSFMPFSYDSNSNVIIPEGHIAAPGESVVSPHQLYVSPGYLEALRVPLKRGRLFSESDRSSAPRVIIVDDNLARRFWPAADPIGRRVYMPSRPADIANPGPGVTWLQVVGVVGSVKLRGLVEGEDARAGAYYIPYMQDPSRDVGFAIRTTGGSDSAVTTAAVQHALAEIDPELQLFDVVALRDRVERSLNPRRAPMLLSLSFGLLALLLASVGIYGVLSYQVSQRTREIGIRMALGSEPSGILTLVLREGLGLVLIGVAAGLLGVLGLKGAIASQLYGVGALDASVIAVVAIVLTAASVAACLGPALRAVRVDPATALQS